MNIDVAGRVKNVQLPASKPLLPLFEAIINSIQAIEDVKENNGAISIEVIRDTSTLFSETDQHLADIVGFTIKDTGIGFDGPNFEAFSTSDTTFKAARGGKGIGRFMWLAAFESVEIESVFVEHGQHSRRRFAFCPNGTGIESHAYLKIAPADRGTIVRLTGFKEKYREQCPKRLETLAAYIVEEFLDYFLGSNCPTMTLHDKATGEAISLDTFYDRTMGVQSDKKRITIHEKEFDVVHVRLYSNHISEHRLYFCAHGRAVIREKLTGIPNLVRRFLDKDNEEFVYAAYVNSSVLDEAVNADRTGFNLTEDSSDLLASALTMSEIRDAIRAHCQHFLTPYTEPIAKKKRGRVQQFVDAEGAMYRPILKHLGTAIDAIAPDANNDEIDRQLYDAYHRLQVAIREEGQKLLAATTADEGEFEEFKTRFDEFFEKISEVNRADLARYVCHRKAIIEFLQKQLASQEDQKYKPEDRVHSIIFPRGKTSSEVPFEDHNLWLIDERLAFHVFLSSDRQIKQAHVLENKSKKEPDILIFDKAVAFAETPDLPFSSITIIEFKRPMRAEYSEKDNPFSQVYKYIEEIKSGNAKNLEGRPIPIQKNLPFYCYIVCDLTPKLKEWARQSALQPTPDALGFFGYNSNFDAYCEVISYNKLVSDAHKRNQAFFKKLGLA